MNDFSLRDKGGVLTEGEKQFADETKGKHCNNIAQSSSIARVIAIS